jgi:hypothetical protein
VTGFQSWGDMLTSVPPARGCHSPPPPPPLLIGWAAVTDLRGFISCFRVHVAGTPSSPVPTNCLTLRRKVVDWSYGFIDGPDRFIPGNLHTGFAQTNPVFHTCYAHCKMTRNAIAQSSAETKCCNMQTCEFVAAALPHMPPAHLKRPSGSAF